MPRSEASGDATSVYSFTTEDTATSEELARRRPKKYSFYKRFAYQKLNGWRPVLSPHGAGEKMKGGRRHRICPASPSSPGPAPLTIRASDANSCHAILLPQRSFSWLRGCFCWRWGCPS